MALIEACRAGFKYAENTIFKDVSFTVQPGEIFCLLGPNGCGKTTLLDCLISSKKLHNGMILLKGEDIRTLTSVDIAKRLAYVPQDHHKSFPYTVEEVVMMGRAPFIGMFSQPGEADYAIVHGILADLGLSQFRERPYTQISGGQLQLVMIARALAQQAPLLVMDEPTSHLDFKHEILLLDMISRIVRETGITVLMASHFPNQVFYLENQGVPVRAALMNEQALCYCGEPSEVITSNTLQEVYGVVTRVVTYPGTDGQDCKYIVPMGMAEKGGKKI